MIRRKSPITALQAARRWAAEHPDASGFVTVKTLPNPWKWSDSKDFTVYVCGGNAALTRNLHTSRHFNGQCVVCGQVFLAPVLQPAYAPHPDAGKPLPLVPGSRAIVADMGIFNGACPDCITKHNLMVGYPPLQPARETAPGIWPLTYTRAHPLCNTSGPWGLQVAVLDIRKEQAAAVPLHKEQGNE